MAQSFYEVITEAVNDIALRGYVSAEYIDEWVRRIREAAARSLTPAHVLEDALRTTFANSYRRLIENGGILPQHQGATRFTIDKVRPQLRRELDRSILASAGLIRLNRDAAIEKTIQRFAGWATSIPPGGSKTVDRVETKDDIRKALASLPFEERRVSIDQGHKFAANLSHILAMDGGAIAAQWQRHHVTYPRPKHVARNGRFFLVRNSWAHEAGLVKPGPNGYTDEIERPGQLVLCRCSYRWFYGLRDLPGELVTQKGRESLLTARTLRA